MFYTNLYHSKSHNSGDIQTVNIVQEEDIHAHFKDEQKNSCEGYLTIMSRIPKDF